MLVREMKHSKPSTASEPRWRKKKAAESTLFFRLTYQRRLSTPFDSPESPAPSSSSKRIHAPPIRHPRYGKFCSAHLCTLPSIFSPKHTPYRPTHHKYFRTALKIFSPTKNIFQKQSPPANPHSRLLRRLQTIQTKKQA